MLTALLLAWVIADCSIKLYFSRLRRLDAIEHGQRLRSDLIRVLTLEAAQQCLDCKRLRGHDDDCGLDMSSLPPRSDAGQDVR
jgi:hypothetical protein